MPRDEMRLGGDPDGRVGAAIVGADKHQNAEREVRTSYDKALLALASLLCLSVCGSIASSALNIFVFNESLVRSRREAGLKACAISVVLGARRPRAARHDVDVVITPRDSPCWELVDPAMTDVPDHFLNGDPGLTGTLKVGPAVKTIGAWAFSNTRLTWCWRRCWRPSLAGLDLSDATSLVSIGENAFRHTELGGTLVIPATVTRIGTSAFAHTKLTGLDLSKATSLVEIGDYAFHATNLTGTFVIPATVSRIGIFAFQGKPNSQPKSLDLSKATSLVRIGDNAFSGIDLAEHGGIWTY